MSSSNNAWVTLATNDSYSLGALVLAHSLKAVKTAHKLAILITPGVTVPMKKQIEAVFDEVKVVDVLDSRDQTHLALMCRPELGVTFTKLHCWTFTNYDKCVFLDADTLVLQNCDELFQREELSAAPDPGWPDCFNSGVFVYKPSQDTFGQLLEFARTRGSFDGGDQGLLNMFFKEWSNTDISKHLSFTYNVIWSSTYSYLPALKQFGQNMKIIHFISSSKPWLQSFNTETRLVTSTHGGSGLQELLQLWWDLFCRHVHPELSTEMIESRLSSRYSYDFHPKSYNNNNTSDNYSPYNQNNYTFDNNTSNNYYNIPTYDPPKEDHYDFIDPWDEYLVEKIEQTSYEVEKINVDGDRNLVEVYLNNHGEQEMENNYCINNFHTEEQTRDCSFQNNLVEECNTFENDEKNSENVEEVREFNEQKQVQMPEPSWSISDKQNPACSDDIPNNPISSLSVNNCRPDSPTHCEVPKDQNCHINGGLAGQFARVSLGEKTVEQKALEDFLRRQSWEQGNVDYLGRDSFSNIWSKINETLGSTPEVSIETVAVKKSTPPEVVHTEEPKPLKSVLKKTSTTIPPVSSEIEIDSSDLAVKPLVKLDLSKNIVKELKTPDTPTVTSPTPPTTPATQAKETVKPLSVESNEETVKSDVLVKESEPSVELKSAEPESVELVKELPVSDACSLKLSKQELPKPELVDPVKETLSSDAGTVSKESSKLEKSTLESSSPVPKTDEPVTCVPQPPETAQATQISVDNSTPLVSNDPPVAPKRTNKGSQSGSKNAKSPEKK
ncbi:glycogenin-1 isoform X1 [Melanaphis sacchari]|uniref:glycogenin-1 isoform X1 n=1 Tax=Melanaphis sacchari TaxID=742174 RepID=UPI000DC14344|nr:glycogenin-1 isoform X1 [Melanaphis sacchari]